MPFTVEDIRDLLRLLEANPEWRAEVRRAVLTDELLALPELVRDLAERLDRLTERVDQLAQRVDQLAQRVDQLVAVVQQLASAQVRTEARLASAEDRIGHALGAVAEIRYRSRGGAYFSRIARRVRAMDSGELADQLLDAVEAGTLSEEERQAILLADLVFTARRLDNSEDIYLVVEVSHGAGPEDVTRALHRARLLARLGRPVLPVVAGASITDDAAGAAVAAGVWQVLDGRTIAPSSA